MEIHKYLHMMSKFGASDLHIKANQPPVFRVNGTISRVKGVEDLSLEDTERMLDPLLTDYHRELLENSGGTDLSIFLPDTGRYRCNIFKQSGSLSAAIRRVNDQIPTLAELNLPKYLERISDCEHGLVIVGGVTGSGKSTTLASILQSINLKRRCHILTIEDPIEYQFTEEKAIITQREIGIDVVDWPQALRAAMRQDPDVILIGEMRDAATIEAAISAAETGHLVLGTLHSSSIGTTVGRIIEFFPKNMQGNVRHALGTNLRAIINQRLIQSTDKAHPQIPAIETTLVPPILRKLIMEDEDESINASVKNDKDESSVVYNQCLQRLHKEKKITTETALGASPNPEELRMILRGITISDSAGGNLRN